MKKHRIIDKPWFRIGGIALVLGLLIGAASFLPETVASSPLAQDEVVNLGCGDEVMKTIEPEDNYYIYQVNVPPGAELSVWVGLDAQGSCEWYAALFINGNEVDRTYVDEPDTWSDPIVATIPGGVAEVEVGEGTVCIEPVHKYVYFSVTCPDCEAPEIWVDRGCGSEYDIGDPMRVYFQLDCRQYVEIYVTTSEGTSLIYSGTLDAGTWYIDGTVGEPPGAHSARAVNVLAAGRPSDGAV